MAGMPKTPFVAPKGIRMVRIDRKSGKRVYGGWPDDDPRSPVIWDVFKPETEPRRSIRREELLARLEARKAQLIAERNARLMADRQRRSGPAQNDAEFLQDEGGIY